MAQSVVFSRGPAAGEFVTPLGIPQEVRFGNGKRRRERGDGGEGARSHVGRCQRSWRRREPPPPPPDQRYHHQAEGRHFGLQSVEFLTSVVERSAGPTSRKHRSRRDARRSWRGGGASPIRRIVLFPNLSASEWEIMRPAQKPVKQYFKEALNSNKSALASQLKEAK